MLLCAIRYKFELRIVFALEHGRLACYDVFDKQGDLFGNYKLK